MKRGYIKIWRRIEDSPVFADAHLFQVFVWCLIRATHQPYSVPVRTGRGQTVVTLQAGQFIFGRNAAAKALRCKPSSIRNRIDILRKRKILDIHPDTHYSVVTITNWHLYQQNSAELGQATGQAAGQAKDTYKNLKNNDQTLFSSNRVACAPTKILDKGGEATPETVTTAPSHIAPAIALPPVGNNAVHFPGEFERFCKAYPREVDRSETAPTWNSVTRYDAPPDRLIAAAIVYARRMMREGREPGKMKRAFRFLSQGYWRDYCPGEKGARYADAAGMAH